MKIFYLNLMQKLATPMTAIAPYSKRYFELAILILILALAFAFLFAKTRVNRAGVLTTFGVVLALLEILKQCLLSYILGRYAWEHFPWHIGSICMYLCLLYPRLKKGRDGADGFLLCFGLLCGAGSLVLPAGHLHGYLWLTICDLASYGILLMLGLYLCMSMSKSRSVVSFRDVALIYVVTALVAFVINRLTAAVSGGASHFFYLGPNYPDLYLANAIYASYGWLVETLVMALVTLAAAFVVYFVSGMGKRK